LLGYTAERDFGNLDFVSPYQKQQQVDWAAELIGLNFEIQRRPL
jgi:hypothetical protein